MAICQAQSLFCRMRPDGAYLEAHQILVILGPRGWDQGLRTVEESEGCGHVFPSESCCVHILVAICLLYVSPCEAALLF